MQDNIPVPVRKMKNILMASKKIYSIRIIGPRFFFTLSFSASLKIAMKILKE